MVNFQYIITIMSEREVSRPYQSIISSGVFRRETASGFYPWGKVDSHRKRVAEGLCGWRHGNSFPMTQSAQSLRQMRSIPLCHKAVFYVFVLTPFTIRKQCIIYTQDLSTDPFFCNDYAKNNYRRHTLLCTACFGFVIY